VREREETSHAVKVEMMFARAAVVDQRVVVVAVAEVLAQTDPHRVSVSESMRMAGPCQLKPMRT
jgi:transcription termination factor NusB